MQDNVTATPTLSMVQIVLRWAWDPIGVGHMAADEYDRYAGPVLEMLNRSASDGEVAAYLTKVESEWMGLTPKPEINEDIASMLRELRGLMR
jgi:hypothetical protein